MGVDPRDNAMPTPVAEEVGESVKVEVRFAGFVPSVSVMSTFVAVVQERSIANGWGGLLAPGVSI